MGDDLGRGWDAKLEMHEILEIHAIYQYWYFVFIAENSK